MRFEKYQIKDLLEEISMGPFGSNIKVECFVDSGIPVLSGCNLTGFAVNDNKLRFVTEEKADSLGKANAYKKDVVVTHRGTLGQVAFIPDTSKYDRYIISQSQFRVRCNEKILPEYMVYYFHTRKGQYKLLSNASQVGVPALARATTTFQSLEIEIPSIEKQKEIVGVLEKIREKIELNERINQNLEQQAMAMFKSWFIDFEPFGGIVPSDWRKYHLSEFLPVITGKKNANVSSEQGKYPFFSCSQNISWTNEYSFDGNAILVAGNGDFNVKWYNGKFEAYQRTYVLIPYEPMFTSWLYYVVKYNLNNITMSARGSVIKFITKGNLENFIFQAPADLNSCTIIETFDLINRAIEARTQENFKLSISRDILLPKLMSGDLDVSDIDT